MEIIKTVSISSRGTGYPDGEGPNLVVYQGLTTANGNIAGNTIVDDGLALLPNLTGLPVWVVSGAYKGQCRLIISHIGNTITVDAAYSGQIVAVTAYMVLPFYMPLAGLVLDIDVPAIDTPNNVLERDVIGNKGDTPVIVLGIVGSLMGYAKGILAQVNWLVATITTAMGYLVELLTRTGQTTFKQQTAGATVVNGVTWSTLYDGSILTKPTQICGFMVTVAGGWAGSSKVRIVNAAGTKIFPFQAEYVEGTDFVSATQAVFNFPVVVPVASGYILQFRSSNAGDGAGKTMALNNLDIIEEG